MQGFIQDFLLGGGGGGDFFGIAKFHLGGVWGHAPSRKPLQSNYPDIESGGFGQLS